MMDRGQPGGADDVSLRVLVIDRDDDLAQLVIAILTDEGYVVGSLNSTDHAAIAAAVGMQEPDCILLDSSATTGFGESWTEASYLRNRKRTVPTVMFTTHMDAVSEAAEGTSDRARDARFAGVVRKPFALDELLDAVATASGSSKPFSRSPAGERARTAALARHLQEAGATDVRTSSRREWATFVSPHDDLIYQFYWWQRLGLYIVGRYDAQARLEIVGQFFERDAAIAAALPPPQ